jgi:uncharacterized glyoxalase superfamily protein PhnB
MDFGRNVGFEAGLAIWEKDYALNLIFKEKKNQTKVGNNNAEIYFESTNLESLYNQLKKEDIKIIHEIREQPWGQKVFRIYDPDKHIIEFAESMTSLVLRLHSKRSTTEEISKKTMMPPEFIKMIIQQHSITQ